MMDEKQHNEHPHEHSHGQCRELLGSLSEYIDGDLEQQLCAEIEQHLQGCENCRVVVDSLRKTVSLYQTTTSSTDVPEAVRERLYKCLNLEEFLSDQA
jgi:anti-sigma factor (TIGR02949 family)